MKVTTDSCVFGAWAAKEIQNAKSKIQSVLDIGTGTGLLSLLVAQKNEVEIDAVEIDEDAFEQAKENISSSPWKNRIDILHEDILCFNPSKKYDCIISNPPFYENELTSAIGKKNIAHHSQQLNLYQVLDFISSHLSHDGVFFLLLPAKRQAEMEKLFQQKKLFVNQTVFLQQSVNHSAFRILIRGSKSDQTSVSSTLSIWNEDQRYTVEFVELLQDYYLYL